MHTGCVEKWQYIWKWISLLYSWYVNVWGSLMEHLRMKTMWTASPLCSSRVHLMSFTCPQAFPLPLPCIILSAWHLVASGVPVHSSGTSIPRVEILHWVVRLGEVGWIWLYCLSCLDVWVVAVHLSGGCSSEWWLFIWVWNGFLILSTNWYCRPHLLH